MAFPTKWINFMTHLFSHILNEVAPGLLAGIKVIVNEDLLFDLGSQKDLVFHHILGSWSFVLILILNLTLGSVFSYFSPKIYIFIASFTLLQDVDAASDGYLPEPHVKFMQCVRMSHLTGWEE